MKNNVLGNVAVGSGRHKKAHFNLSHDVNSTYQFGEVQPVLFRDMIADEKDVVDIESMVRLAPMVAPTFGRIKHKEWHHFIPMTDLFPHYGNFVAQTSYANTFCSNLPSITMGLLSYMCLIGSKMTIYFSSASSHDTAYSEKFKLYINPSVTQTTTQITNILSWIQTTQGASSPFGFQTQFSSSNWNTTQSNAIDLRYLIDPSILTYSGYTPALRPNMDIPVTNFDETSWFDYADKSVDGTAFDYVTDVDAVTLDAADAVIPYIIKDSSNNDRALLLAFRFSNFGKRLYKIFTGLGYQLDFKSTQRVSLLPIFAFYKAWYDTFGLTRYKAWHDTTCYDLLRKYDYAPTNYDFNGCFDANVSSYWSWREWAKFMVELGNCWYTEDTDFVSAHVSEDPSDKTHVNALTMFGKVPDENASNAYVTSSSVQAGLLTRSTPSITVNSATHILSALSIRELMDMYRWCNRNSVAGREVEKILRAQGYGYFLYSCKSNFIGYTEQDVQIYDVVSSSDTFNSSNDDGALLGQYAGRGLGYDKSKSMSFEATEDGYWIGLCAVVPISGYSQGVNPSLLCTDKFSRYNPDLDGKYMTLTPVCSIHGSRPFSEAGAQGDLTRAFGYIPIYSGLKIAQNVSNGGFSLRSQRDIFRPYMLDKCIDFGERASSLAFEDSTMREYQVRKLFTTFPNCGDFWKYVGRYPWLGNYDRIFAHAETLSSQLNMFWSTSAPTIDSSFEYCVTSDDNFMIHHVVNQQAYSPMLPIEQSFITEDEDGNFDTSVEKA